MPVSQTSPNASTFNVPSLDNRQELGLFLRRRRESLDPSRLDILYTGRRRTPGLRREEVAQLANVSTTWYTWLEQGRDIQTSPATLAAIASALQCTEAETRHIFTLAKLNEPVSQKKFCQKLSKIHQVILDQLNPLPALIQNARFDILGINSAYSKLMGVDLDQLADEEKNCLYLCFNHPQWQQRILDLESAQTRIVGSFRAGFSKNMDDPIWQERLALMQKSSTRFNEIWSKYKILEIENLHKDYLIPEYGKLSFSQINWWSAPADGERLMVYLPDNEETENKLHQIYHSNL